MASATADNSYNHAAFSAQKRRKGTHGAMGTSSAERRDAQAPLGRRKDWEMKSRKTASPLKDPNGGLTQRGRDWFRREQGSHLRAGVKKAQSAMSPQEMRRKGSWAVRFYGRKGALPPLQKVDGSPTRFALTARAWGEPVPRTVLAARQIAAKGRRLLAAYRRARSKAR
jgi:hypothetical protein